MLDPNQLLGQTTYHLSMESMGEYTNSYHILRSIHNQYTESLLLSNYMLPQSGKQMGTSIN